MKSNILTSCLESHVFFIALYMIFLALALLPFYLDGTLILGGEGNFVLDFFTHFKNYCFMWFPIFGTGIPNMTPSGNGLNIIFLIVTEYLTGSNAITNFILIFSIYFWPFFAVYLICKELKVSPFVSFIVSLFYVLNPLTSYYLICLNQWNIFSVVIMPLLFMIFLKYYHCNFKLFFFFGFVSTCFSCAYTNPPMLVIIHISILLSTVIISYYHNKKIKFRETFKKYIIIFFSFILFNFWWLFSMFMAIKDSLNIYTKSFANSWLALTVHNAGAIIAKMYFLTTLIGNNPSYDFFTYWYNMSFIKPIILIPILIIVCFVFLGREKRKNILNIIIFSVLLIILFLQKGNSPPFAFLYNFMFNYIPFFNIFKSPVEKFGLLYIFMFSLLLLFAVKNLKSGRFYKPIMSMLTIYLAICSMPVITGNIIPDSNIDPNGQASRRYEDKMEYKHFRKTSNNDELQYRILPLPTTGNYQVCLNNYDNNKYTGMDPLLMNINKPFISAGVQHTNVLFYNISSPNFQKLLGIFNIGKIIINEDLIPWFGSVEKESVSEIKGILDCDMTSEKCGSITIYYNRDFFLPRIYSSAYGY